MNWLCDHSGVLALAPGLDALNTGPYQALGGARGDGGARPRGGAPRHPGHSAHVVLLLHGA